MKLDFKELDFKELDIHWYSLMDVHQWISMEIHQWIWSLPLGPFLLRRRRSWSEGVALHRGLPFTAKKQQKTGCSWFFMVFHDFSWNWISKNWSSKNWSSKKWISIDIHWWISINEYHWWTPIKNDIHWWISINEYGPLPLGPMGPETPRVCLTGTPWCLTWSDASVASGV